MQSQALNPQDELNHAHNTMKTIKYRFICQKQCNFGQAIYIFGNTQHLGQWKLSNAIRLDCYFSKYWITDIQVPIDTQIQYKYFAYKFDHHIQETNPVISDDKWIGDQNNMNFRLFLVKRDATQIQQTQKEKNIKIMSFNLRYQNKGDVDQFHWENRKENCLQIIKQVYPSIIGVQEARKTQKNYLKQNLNSLYNYVGVPRDNQDGQEVGIFYDKQRFIPVQHGYRWISQSKLPGSVGYGASYPRYFTYFILQDTYISQKYLQSLKKVQGQVPIWIPRNLILVQNVHLDHLSGLAQKKGVEMMNKQIQTKCSEYKDQIRDIFLFGDFNTTESNHIFNKFSQVSPKIESIRSYFNRNSLRDSCDYKNTFNGFHCNKEGQETSSLIIDHMFILNTIYRPYKFEVIREMTHKPKNQKYSFASDHYPILGTFKVIKKQNKQINE